MGTLSEVLSDFERWSSLSNGDIQSLKAELTLILGKEFEWNGISRYDPRFAIISVLHLPSNMEFHVIPGGQTRLGLSEKEHAAVCDIPGADRDLLSGMSGTTLRHIEPFLISPLPLLERMAIELIQIDWSVFRPDFRPDDGNDEGWYPIYLTRDEIATICTHYGFRLPTECQWEYAFRGRSESPFNWGDTIPDDEEMKLQIECDYRSTSSRGENAFGIAGMIFGGWCLDSYNCEPANDGVGAMRVRRMWFEEGQG